MMSCCAIIIVTNTCIEGKEIFFNHSEKRLVMGLTEILPEYLFPMLVSISLNPLAN